MTISRGRALLARGLGVLASAALALGVPRPAAGQPAAPAVAAAARSAGEAANRADPSGDWTEAEALHRAWIEVASSHQDVLREGLALLGLSRVFTKTDRPDSALVLAARARDRFTRADHAFNEMMAFLNISARYETLDEPRLARRSLGCARGAIERRPERHDSLDLIASTERRLLERWPALNKASPDTTPCQQLGLPGP